MFGPSTALHPSMQLSSSALRRGPPPGGKSKKSKSSMRYPSTGLPGRPQASNCMSSGAFATNEPAEAAQHDPLIGRKCHGNKGLTLAQVGEFANCLIDARNELQRKSEVIKRKFTITKVLLFRSVIIDRLRQQIYKLEMEQKRLEEDASVYNWLQQQLKLSLAYKKAEKWEIKIKPN
ncbi:hypothetical protein V6N13_136137 [Hibiscus sabdariffa]|uniref:Uncharacterized protein n=2 Tax=Hibiscus sabdariffa TaxID=183260 RepID=A0ABR1ZBB4_9ROSI